MKKFICLMLSVLLLLTATSCRLNVKVEEIAVKGEEITRAQALDLAKEWDKATADMGFADAQWYDVDMRAVVFMSDREDPDDVEENEVNMKMTGKYYISPFVFEIKMKLKIELESVEYSFEDGVEEEIISTAKGEIIMIEGNTYVHLKVTQKSDGYSMETEVYERGMDIDDVVGEAIPGFDFDSLFDMDVSNVETLENMPASTEFYQIKNGLQMYIKQTSGTNSTEMTNEIKAKDGGAKLGSSRTYLSTVQDGVETSMSMSVKSTIFGTSVKKPKDSWRYN